MNQEEERERVRGSGREGGRERDEQRQTDERIDGEAEGESTESGDMSLVITCASNQYFVTQFTANIRYPRYFWKSVTIIDLTNPLYIPRHNVLVILMCLILITGDMSHTLYRDFYKKRKSSLNKTIIH